MPKRLDGTLVTDGFNFDGEKTVTTEKDVTTILPAEDNKVDLGSAAKRFKNIYWSSLTPDPGTGYLPLTGGTMTGAIDMNSHELKNATTISGQFTTKQVDSIVISAGSSTAGNVATYFDSTGLVLANSLISADNIVQNTGGSTTSGNVAIFGDSSGRNISNSLLPYTNLVTAGILAAGQVLTYSGSGKAIISSTTPILGTPASGTLTNCTDLPISTGVSGLSANVKTLLTNFNSANFYTAFPALEPNGTGYPVFDTQPNFTGATQRFQPLKLSTLTQYEANDINSTTTPTSFITTKVVGSRFFGANTTNDGMVIKIRAFSQLNTWDSGGTLTISLYLNGTAVINLLVPTGLAANSIFLTEFDCTIRPSNQCRAQGILHANGQLPVLGDSGGITWTKSISNNVDVLAKWSVTGNQMNSLSLSIETHFQR